MDENVNHLDTLWDLIKDIKFAMLITEHADGHLHSHPVTTQNRNVDRDDSLWFFVSRAGDPAGDIARQPRVNLAYAHPGRDSYVSVSGTAAIVENRLKKEELFSRMTQAWFPGGMDDPDLALLRVRINRAHFWDVREHKLVQLYKLAKAAITGKRPDDLGETGEVRMAAGRQAGAPG